MQTDIFRQLSTQQIVVLQCKDDLTSRIVELRFARTTNPGVS